MTVIPLGASADTLWNGAPGEPLPSGVAIRIKDQRGNAVAGAVVTWEAVARNSAVLASSTVSDARGLATAVWQLGTSAGEEQQLRVLVQSGREHRELTIRARAVPHVVAQLRVSADTLAPLRVGDSLSIAATAIDPYGNLFSIPPAQLSLSDTTVGRVAGAMVVGGPKRGTTELTVTSNGVSARVPLHVLQVVAAIRPASDTLYFTSLKAKRPVQYLVRDDKGGVVGDTAATLSVSDTAIAQLTDSGLQAVTPGVTTVRLAVGAVRATATVRVQQRIATLALRRDTIRFDALLDTTTIYAIAHDSLGSPISYPAVVVQVTDAGVAKLADPNVVQALTPGVTVLTLLDPATGISVSAPLVVEQRTATIELTPPAFDALGDTLPIQVAAKDRLGSPIPAPILEYSVSDTMVATVEPGSRLRSVREGRFVLTIRDPETGASASPEITVSQRAVSLSVVSTFGNPVITLPAGAPFPLACQALDKNGYAIARDPMLIGSRKGTVTGTGCADARVARSGYDTLVFDLAGKSATLPVIVATAPDSTGVIVAAESLPTTQRIRFEGEDLTNSAVLALRPLVQDILGEYGSPSTALGRARALRDWVARTAVHPHPPIHPDGSTANLAVLPPGKTWFDVNSIIYRQSNLDSMTEASNAYWQTVGYDGYAMLDRLLGTLDPVTGIRADDGMMIHLGGAEYRIRDIESYRYPICTFQAIMLNALWAAAGLQGMLGSTIDHDPAAVFIPDLSKWVYEDPTFNEEYSLNGVGNPLSPTELLDYSSNGESGQLQAKKMQGPSFDPEPYIATESYLSEHPKGMVIMGSQLNSRVVGIGGWNTRLVQIDVPALTTAPLPYSDATNYVRVAPQDAFPTLGPVIDGVQAQDSVFVIRLSSTFPNHAGFERRLNGGNWENVLSSDVLPVGQCKVEYRSVDSMGNYSATTVVDVWAPRGDGFLSDVGVGTVRAQAVFCFSTN